MSRTDEIRVERPTADSAVVVLTGQHDLSNSPDLERLLDSLIAETKLVVADVSEAEFVDSTIPDTLVRMHRQAAEVGRTFRVQLGTEAIVRRVFELTGVLEVLDWAPTREEALRPPSEGQP
jgi:anti-anti-sigma factor